MAHDSIPLLTEFEKEHISERQPLPETVSRPVRRRDGRAHCRGAREARQPAGHPRPSLSARRSDQVRRLHRRLVPARAARSPSRPEADYIVFCGVHFMAESADVLCAPHQQVILPDLAAGCSMADMAEPDQLETCWEELTQMGVASASCRSPTSTPPRRSKRSSASAAAPSARRRTPRRR